MNSILQYRKYYYKNKYQLIQFFIIFLSIVILYSSISNFRIGRGYNFFTHNFFSILAFIASLYLFISTSFSIISRFKKGSFFSDLTVYNQGLILFDGIFYHKIAWNEIKSINYHSKEILIIEWQDSTLENKKLSNNILRNYHYKKLLPSFAIDFNKYKKGYHIDRSIKQYFNIVTKFI